MEDCRRNDTLVTSYFVSALECDRIWSNGEEYTLGEKYTHWGEVYTLVAAAKKRLPKCKLVLSGVLRRRDVSWRRIGGLNDRLAWVANAVGLTCVDPDDFVGDGVHLNGRGKRLIWSLYARVSRLAGEGSAESMK